MQNSVPNKLDPDDIAALVTLDAAKNLAIAEEELYDNSYALSFNINLIFVPVIAICGAIYYHYFHE